MKANVNGVVIQLVFLELKIFSVNGPSGKITLMKAVPLTDEWKDRDFGFGPVFDGTTQFKDGTIVQTINLTTNKPNLTFPGRRPHLYFITAKHLHSMDVANGFISECISLPGQYRYTHLYIDHKTCLLVVSSVKNKASLDIVMAFAFYNYNPIQLLQLLEVTPLIEDMS